MGIEKALMGAEHAARAVRKELREIAIYRTENS